MNEHIITTYISAWMWHLIGILFFIKGIDYLKDRDYVWMVGMIGVLLFCEVMAYKRKIKVEELEDEI